MMRRNHIARHSNQNQEQEANRTSLSDRSSSGSFSFMQQTIGNKALAQLMETQAKGNHKEAGNGFTTQLPTSLKSGVEALSGYSMDDVQVSYNSPKPSKLGAAAYASGSDIHVAPGGEKHLPHEAWHVVQQKRGQVQATKQIGNTPVNDNASLEQEATEMGEQANKLGGEALAADKDTKKITAVQAAAPSQLAVAQLAEASENYSETIDDEDIELYGDSINRLLDKIKHCVEEGKDRALQWRDFEHETAEAHLRLWYDMASDYVNNPVQKPKLLNARFGYAIETLACIELGDAFEDFELKYQITHGSTRPDIVVCTEDGDELAWIDITSTGSEGHIAEKVGAGWKRKPFVHEVLYDALDPTDLSSNSNNPYLKKLGEFVEEENDIVRSEKLKTKRLIAGRMDRFANKREWTAGRGVAKRKASQTRDKLFRVAGGGIQKPRHSLKATKGALTYLNLTTTRYGFKAKDKQENEFIKSIIKGHASNNISNRKRELNEDYNADLNDKLADFNYEPAVQQYEAEYNNSSSSRELVQKGLALSAALEERENLMQLGQQLMDSDRDTENEQDEIGEIIYKFPTALDTNGLNEWIKEAVAYRDALEQEEEVDMNIEDEEEEMVI